MGNSYGCDGSRGAVDMAGRWTTSAGRGRHGVDVSGRGQDRFGAGFGASGRSVAAGGKGVWWRIGG